MADGQSEGRVISDGQREALQRRSSKSRLSKQDEVEEHEDDNSPSSEASDATIVPTGILSASNYREISNCSSISNRSRLPNFQKI